MGDGFENFVQGTFFVVGMALLLTPICRVGALDLIRTGYNFGIGDAPQLKHRLVDYCRAGVRREHPDLDSKGVEGKLRAELGFHREGDIDPEYISIERLWDVSEDYAHSGTDRWIWADLH